MANFPTYDFAKEFVKTRFLEPHAGDAINVRALALPRGVYLGFIPQATPGSDILVLATDPNHGFSKLSVGSQTRKMQVDLFTAADVNLNFNAHTVFPVYVLARADYRDKVATQARILTRATTASGPQEVLICKVDKVAGNLTVAYDFPETRQPPIAFDGQVAGFMPDDAINDVAIGNSTRTEITAARLSTHTGAHGSLADRIEDDLLGPSMADRLGLRSNLLVSNLKSGVSGTSTNVSGSFAATNREIEPVLDIEPNGTESVEGAITDPSDTLRNLCFVVNGATGQRLVAQTTQDPVYGHVAFSSGAVSGTINFYNGTTGVDGTGSPFTSINEGDLVKAVAPGDDKWYEVAEITDANNAILGAAFQGGVPGGPAVPVVNPPYRRFTLSFFTVAGGAYSVPAGTAIKFLFPAFHRPDRSIFDGWLFLKRNAALPPVPDATESVAGKATLAAPDGKVGSFRTVENNGSSIGNDFHTLNFAYGGATNLGLGVAEVSVVGATGPQGEHSNEGVKGPDGDPGYGYVSCNPFVPTAAWHGAGPPFSYTHNVDFSALAPTISTIRHVFGGFAGLKGMWPGRQYTITNISGVGTSIGSVGGSISGAAAAGMQFKLWVGACE